MLRKDDGVVPRSDGLNTDLAEPSELLPPSLVTGARPARRVVEQTGVLVTVGLGALLGTWAIAFDPVDPEWWVESASALAVGVSLLSTGAWLLRSAEGVRSGVALWCVGTTWPLLWPMLTRDDLVSFLAFNYSSVVWMPLLYVVLNHPSNIPVARATRPFLWLALIVFGPMNCLLGLASRPEWLGLTADSAWWDPLESKDLSSFLFYSYAICCVAIAGGILVLMVGRLKAAAGLDRVVLFPSLCGIAAAAALCATGQVLQVYWASPSGLRRAIILQQFGLLLFPATVLIVQMRLRAARTRIADVITAVARPATATNVEEALRLALHDSTVQVELWSSARNKPMVLDTPMVETSYADRVVVPVLSADGELLANITTDGRLAQYPALLSAAVTSAGMAIENAHMDAELRTLLREARESRTRIYEAQIRERRRLERNLHDGAQQRLLGINLAIEAERHTTADGRTAARLLDVRNQLQEAIEEIRRLARGLNPASLQQGGLRSVVEEMASTLPFRVILNIAVERLEPELEVAAYYAVSESLVNVRRHARARSVEIGIRREQVVGSAVARLIVRVEDDGVGGAQESPEGGLRGIADRVAALGGRLHVHSRPGTGTTVTVELPCAS